MEGQTAYLPFILSNGKLKFKGHANSLRLAQISGSKKSLLVKNYGTSSNHFLQLNRRSSIAPLPLIIVATLCVIAQKQKRKSNGKRIINPWKWQDSSSYVQAVEVKKPEGTLYISGQAAIDADGKSSTEDMKVQLSLS